jgi:hypothetical protein
MIQYAPRAIPLDVRVRRVDTGRRASAVEGDVHPRSSGYLTRLSFSREAYHQTRRMLRLWLG